MASKNVPELKITHVPEEFVSDDRRVITRFFDPGGPHRIRAIVERVMGLGEDEADAAWAQILRKYEHRHRDIYSVFRDHFKEATRLCDISRQINGTRQLLLGAYFTREYSVESAALFNPSIVPAPNQEGLPPGAQRFFMSLRATGEGHVSSLVFRTGTLLPEGMMEFDPPSAFAQRLKPAAGLRYAKDWLQRKLIANEGCSGACLKILDRLDEVFTVVEVNRAVDGLASLAGSEDSIRQAAEQIRWICDSHYVIDIPEDTDLSEIVIFPSTASESHGIEDVRFVQFFHEDGESLYYATYTAFNGNRMQSQLMEMRDFRSVRVRALQGPYVQNKGLALFPRKIGGLYCMLSRIDGENNYIMYSPDITYWDSASLLQVPRYPWEFVQIGNCGSPMETEHGWLLLTHGVGPMREYSIGAMLLDLEDPSKVVGQLAEPLIVPTEEDREGYVPNVVYSCGALIHDGRLIIPYAKADRSTSIASLPVEDLLTHLVTA